MALPASGAISMSQVNTELGLSATATISMNDAAVRNLFGKASGAISMSDGHGKSSEVRFINTAARTGASIFALMGSPTAVGNYVFENQAIISAGTGTFALRTGVFPAGSTLKIINKSTIRGRGGAGGTYSAAPGAGGAALHVDFPCSLDNGAGYIYGGGGGGAWRRHYINSTYTASAGGGGGAGASGGVKGTTATNSQFYYLVQPADGTTTAGGARGSVADEDTGIYYGGVGGGIATAGGTGTGQLLTPGTITNSAAGAAGAAIVKNGNTVTITAGNDTTRIKGANA